MKEIISTPVCLNDVFLAFLIYLNDVLSPQPTEMLYVPEHGICANFHEFCMQRYSNIIDLNHDDGEWRDEEYLEEKFDAAGLDYLLPFNPTLAHYHDEGNQGTRYKNPERLKWIANQLLACGIKPSFTYTNGQNSSTETDENEQP